jgi:hypothetical protein
VAPGSSCSFGAAETVEGEAVLLVALVTCATLLVQDATFPWTATLTALPALEWVPLALVLADEFTTAFWESSARLSRLFTVQGFGGVECHHDNNCQKKQCEFHCGN